MAEDCYRCGKEGPVGIGTDEGIKYVCMDHFREWLKGTREILDRRLSKEGKQ